MEAAPAKVHQVKVSQDDELIPYSLHKLRFYSTSCSCFNVTPIKATMVPIIKYLQAPMTNVQCVNAT